MMTVLSSEQEANLESDGAKDSPRTCSLCASMFCRYAMVLWNKA